MCGVRVKKKSMEGEENCGGVCSGTQKGTMGTEKVNEQRAQSSTRILEIMRRMNLDLESRVLVSTSSSVHQDSSGGKHRFRGTTGLVIGWGCE
jgi:hypothetical protein